jgi:hypothetical protein
MKKLVLFFILPDLLFACNNKKQQDTENITQTVMPVKNNIGSVRDIFQIPETINKPTAKQLIVPGKSIGQIMIGEKMEEVAHLLGIPDYGDAAMGKAISIWYSKNSTKKYSTTIYSTSNFGDTNEVKKVQNIRVTSPYFITENFIKCESNLRFIQQQYPEMKKPQAYYKDTASLTRINIFENIKEGIAFEINKSGKCVGISVYKPGKRITQTYLPVFPGIQTY